MRIEYDPTKRKQALEDNRPDFKDAASVFEGFYLTRTDDRKDYGEVRNVVLGCIGNRPVVLVWTPRDDAIRVISLRKANDEECEIYRRELERSG